MISVVVITLIILMLGWKHFYQNEWWKELTVKFAFGHNSVYAGESVYLKEIIENRKKLPVTPLEVRFRVKKGVKFAETDNMSVSDFVYKRDIYALLGRQRITRKLKMECLKRGYYQIEDISILSYSLLHDNTYRMEMDSDAAVCVYAKRTNVKKLLDACQQLMGEVESQQKYLEDPFAFSSIREYTIQDPMKAINWKASAKTGGLMVNTYTSMRSESVMIYLDVEDSRGWKKEHLIEDSISVAATLFEKLIKKGSVVGICVNVKADTKEGVFCCPPTRNTHALTMVERFLATGWKESDVVTLETLFTIPYNDSIPVVISKDATQARLEQAESKMGLKQKGIWVLPVTYGEKYEMPKGRFVFLEREVEKV